MQARVERVISDNLGVGEPVGAGVFELRINYSPGYRVYFQERVTVPIILLAGLDIIAWQEVDLDRTREGFVMRKTVRSALWRLKL